MNAIFRVNKVVVLKYFFSKYNYLNDFQSEILISTGNKFNVQYKIKQMHFNIYYNKHIKIQIEETDLHSQKIQI